MPNQRKAGITAFLVRMTEAEKKRLKEAAKAEKITATEFARQAIFERVEEIEKNNLKNS